MTINICHRSTTSFPHRIRQLVALLATGLAVVIWLTPTASAEIVFGSSGSGAGQLDTPYGVAVDSSNGHLYVADQFNHRVSVFESDGSFLYAFGWGVADGTSPGLQSCTSTCSRGIASGGAGGFDRPASIAVDNDPASSSYHDVYVFEQARIQKFTPSGEFLRAWGGGVITGGATGKGDLSAGSATVTNVITTKKAFAIGQTISGAGIPTATKIVAVDANALTLSKAATSTFPGTNLSVAEGTGNVPMDEVQIFKITQPTYDTTNPNASSFQLSFRTLGPSFAETVTSNIPSDASAAEVQSALTALPNIGPGNVTVTSPNPGGVPGTSGGPYTIKFQGARFADTDVEPLVPTGTGPSRETEIVQNGASSPELCLPGNATDCTSGVLGKEPGQFGRINAPIDIGAAGVVFVGDGLTDGEFKYPIKIQKFEASGEHLEDILLPGNNQIISIATDSSGDFYVTRDGPGGALDKYDSSGVLLGTLPGGGSFLTVDESDHLYVAQAEAGFKVITEFSPDGSPQRRFGYESIGENLGGIVAYSSPDGDVFGTESFSNRIRYLPLPPAGPISCCANATGVGNAKATLNGRVNPEGKATIYHFDYVDQAGFEAAGFTGPTTKSSPEMSIGSDVTLHAVSFKADVVPSTTYHFRLVATNPDGSSTSEGTFESLPPLEVGDTWSTEVGTDAAVLHAEVNPLGIPTSAHFEYVDDATYQADVAAGGASHGFDHAIKAPNAAIDLGSGETVKRISAFLYPLDGDTIYHYRVVAEDPFVTVRGDERMLKTFPRPAAGAINCENQALRTGPSANLPDCRAFEMISPVDKNGNDIRVNLNVANVPAALDRSSDDASRLSYSSSSAFAGAASGPWTSQYIATRDSVSGWATHPISPPGEPDSIGAAINIYLDGQYKAFNADLSSGWLLHDRGPILDKCAAEGFLNLYRRDDASGGYEALTTAPPTNHAPETYWPELQGLSADGTHAVFAANGKLTQDASNSSEYQLYEHIAAKRGCGTLRLVSVLPNGSANISPSSVGTAWSARRIGEGRDNSVLNAVSEDGSRIFWSAVSKATGSRGAGPLYLRIDGKETLQVSATPSVFLGANPDGSKAIYMTNLGSSGFEFQDFGDLYEYDVESATPTLIASEAYGLAGASKDVSHLYFVSKQALAPKAEAGKRNLYSRSGGETKFVATISASDGPFGLQPFAVTASSLVSRGTRTTADGSHLAFVSKASLTGYDNKDAVDGQASLEVYLYDAGTDTLACISCDPTGARPQARLIRNGLNVTHVSAELTAAENQLFAPRALSADGNKLFFNSYNALVPRDTNGRKDVYEWERSADEQGCDEAGAELYVSSSGGCLSLISSGQSPKDSEFDDASPDGSSVFIKTASSLLPQDDGLIDVYVAREGGGFPPPPTTPPSCEGEACQGPPSPPNDPTPASSAFEGAGNVKEEPQGRKPGCAKGKTRRKGRCVAKKPHATKTNPHKKRAANHKRRAGR